MSEEVITLLTEIRDILQHQNEPKMLFTKDVARIMGMNVGDAGKLWKRDDFPGIDIGQKKVEQTAFKEWLQMRRKEE